MARQQIRPQARLVPNIPGLTDPAAQDSADPQMQTALAEMAALSNVPLTNSLISQFLRNVSNSTLTGSIQSLENLVQGNL